MLLVDDGQCQPAELDALLEQRVGTDGDRRLAACQPGASIVALLLREAAREPGHLDAGRREPARELAEGLLGEQLGRRHHSHLGAGFDRLRGSECSHQGLAAADVALKQTLHRLGAREVGGDFTEHTGLCAGRLEACGGEYLARDAASDGQRPRAPGSAAVAVHAHRQLLRQQFIELHASPGGVGAVGERGGVDVGGGRVQQVQALVERRQPEAAEQ